MRPRHAERGTRLSSRCWLLVAAMLAAPGLAHAADNFDPATGYRISRYRAPVPESVPGGARVDSEAVKRLVSEKSALLIDVMPSNGAGLDTASGRWRMLRQHEHIPGSTWLPDVGAGALTPLMESYFRDELARLTQGDRARALVFYCQADCWMSWNATKRASEYGYTTLYWFPEGTDGWRDWEGPLVPATPVPVAGAALDRG
ncbi:rhodanese-like domain-containing protein [Hyphomicrobium zavarzinii]|uniref:rhodanese-like domain-containing protein n=1 Tax=Hyphomicrobium zavarzinii TaxID=48292 RepID=UPI0012EB278A|nr:rhodanese-like domain-containing protein [Hyphomicrobium zavarzinii]